MEMEGGHRLVLIVIIALSSCMASALRQNDGFSSSKLQIHIPPSLRIEKDGYEHQEALFGNPPYGGSIVQQLYYADSDFCAPAVDTAKGYPRRDVDPNTGRMYPWESPFLLMIDRGNCAIVTKVRRAQHAGAAGVIIADNLCLCNAKCAGETTKCRPESPMENDGSGKDITIPSFLMYKHDADRVKEALRNDTLVQMEMSWSLPKANVAEYSFWSTPANPSMLRLQEKFGDVVALLGSTAKFTPHYRIINGAKLGCTQGTPDASHPCKDMCTNAGRYCGQSNSVHPPIVNSVSGMNAIVEESLRQICIWRIYGATDRPVAALEWWRYVVFFAQQCATRGGILLDNTTECVASAMRIAGVNPKGVQRCMRDSGGLHGAQENVLLEEEMRVVDEYGVIAWPAMTVNKRPIRGGLTMEVALEALCAGYTNDHKPAVCQCANDSGGAHHCVLHGQTLQTKMENHPLGVLEPVSLGDDDWHRQDETIGSGGNGHALLVVGILLSVVGLLAFVRYKRSQERHHRDQVHDTLRRYMPLSSFEMTDSSTQTFELDPGVPFDYQRMEESSHKSEK